jgi:hypothetical protein
VEKPGGKRRGQERAHRERAGRFAKDRDILRIAAKGRDVLLDPAECGHLIELAVVARSISARLTRELRVRKEPEDAQPVIDRDNDDPLARERIAIVTRLSAGTRLEPTAVDPHHHRQPIARRRRRGPHVEIEAVLARRTWKRDVPENLALHAMGSEFCRVANAYPWARGPRFLPPELADGRVRERDALEDADLPVGTGRALQEPTGRLDLRRGRSAHGDTREECDRRGSQWLSVH